jgi:hypothetical protein
MSFFLICFSSSCFLCTQIQLSLDCPLLIAPSVFSNLYLLLLNANSEVYKLYLLRNQCWKQQINLKKPEWTINMVRYGQFRESTSWIISPSKFWTATIFLHAHLQVVYYNCVKFHKNPISRLGGDALTRYMPPLFRESISWIISPFRFWTATYTPADVHEGIRCCPKFRRGDN